MTRRARFVAGLLALFALTFSLAESVWASTCAMAATEMTMSVAAPDPLATDGLPAGKHCAGHADHGGDPDRAPEEEPCPFGSPAATQVCAGVASLPAPSALPSAPSPEGVSGPFVPDAGSDLLLVNALFRPPRA